MTTKAVLVAARARILDPAHWTQGALARDKNGVPMSDVFNTAAACWCATGALHLCGHSAKNVKFYTALSHLSRFTGGSGIAKFNDKHTHREVIAMFDAAIRAEDFSE